MRLSGIRISIHVFIFMAFLNSTSPPAVAAPDAVSLLRKMEEAYAGVRDYQADDRFRAGVATRYLFLIDKKTWLPAGVEESTPEGALERKITFRNLRVNVGVPDSVFEVERE